MRIGRLLGVLVLAGGCSTAGAPNGPRPPYTEAEHLTMTKCVGLSNLALAIGAVKLRGASAEELKERYAEAPDQPIPAAVTDEVIDGVFRLEADSPYAYSVAYFASCSEQVAQISGERLSPAQGCMSQANMALAARISKERGTPQETEVQNLAQYGVPRTKEIVERVYAQSQSPGETQTDAWESCMAPFRAP
ncbi:MAG TPA: hypothetical protein VMR86_18980 [Myxococcota bacterium]|nr:hypothetical protein [Myxococcota bacterium]